MNKNLFASPSSVPATDTVNAAGGQAYSLDARTRLAKLAMVGTLTDAFYCDGKQQLDTLVATAAEVAPEYLAKAALLASEKGFIKDAPVVLLALLSKRDVALFKQIAPRILRSAKSIKNFVRVMRSGVAGRKSLGRAARTVINLWLAKRSAHKLVLDSVRGDPSLADVIRLSHFKPPVGLLEGEVASPDRRQVVSWILGKDAAPRPAELVDLDEWATDPDPSRVVPDLPIQMFGDKNLSAEKWAALAPTLTWQTLRQELNALTKRGAFGIAGTTEACALRLADPEQIRIGKAMPYQILSTLTGCWGESGVTSWANGAGEAPPVALMVALQQALDACLVNVKALPGKVRVALDVSGSMTSCKIGKSSVTAALGGAVFAAALAKTNPNAELIVFDEQPYAVTLNPLDPTWTMAKSIPFKGGGTACGCALAGVAVTKPDWIILISDNQSWADWGSGAALPWGGVPNGSGALCTEWSRYRRTLNSKARLVLMDLTPSKTVQVKQGDGVLAIGGLNDSVFEILHQWAEHGDDLAAVVEKVSIEEPRVE